MIWNKFLSKYIFEGCIRKCDRTYISWE